MKLYLPYFIAALSCLPSVHGQTIANPVQHFASARGLTSSDQIKKIEIDLNGDGVNDTLLAYEDPNPDIVERQARKMERGVLRWDVYIKGVSGNYTLSTGIEKDGETNLGSGLPFKPDGVHVGQISEISRHALIAFFLRNIRGQSSTVSIIAYTWEGDHFKEHLLASYPESEQNDVFDKYLAEGHRTVVQVQQVTP